MVIESIMLGGNYDSMSFSSKDNVYELIWYYDVVMAAADKGSENAAIITYDFDRLLNSKYKCRPMGRIKDCLSIQMGEVDIGRGYPEKNLVELLAELRGESLIGSEEELEKDIDEIIRLSNYYWRRSLEYKRSRGFYGKANRVDVAGNEKYWELDRELKEKRFPKIQLDRPESLNVLESTYGRVSSNLAELREIDDRTKEEQKEMNKLIKYTISLAEDIKIIKESYGIPYEVNDLTLRKSNSITVSYVGHMHDSEDNSDYDFESGFVSEWQINKIRYICQELLTPRQSMYFEMYYIMGMTQREIGQLTLREQPNVSQSLSTSVEKIKSFLENRS